MKRIIPFTDDIKFNTKIYEISSISLEHNLKLNNDNLIKGEFIISGNYKITSSSINEEPFIYSLPFDIALDDKYDAESVEIDIDDFNYEIINEEVLRVKISVFLDGIKLIKEEDEIIPDIIIKDERNTINEEVNEQEITPEENIKDQNEEVKVQKEERENIIYENEIIEELEEKKENMIDLFKEDKKEATPVINENNDIFESITSEEEYVTYIVHIVRGDDNIDTICKKYEVSKEEVEKYNDLNNITLGTKIIIPYVNESI